MRFPVLSALILLSGVSSSAADKKDKPSSYSIERTLVKETGDGSGKEFVHNNVTYYIAKPSPANPRTKARSDIAVLYLTDVYGLPLPENQRLMDSFAMAGYLTVGPDLFQGVPAPNDINTPGFNTSVFLAKHTPEVTDPIVASAIGYLRDKLKVKKVAVAGYCYGGKYAFRFVAGGGAQQAIADVAFSAHPSLLTESEISAVSKPMAVAAAETDSLLNVTARSNMEVLLKETGQRYQVNLYSGTPHGFAVRANLSDPQQKYGKEESFVQAVRWFDTFFITNGV
ncbi:protein AIM2 [Cladorrhinum samala]|uniref:Protein AIM2 n=1 Tax=Cladorrhinum samala TaxID=585594 RepID=A0AAV9HTD8_9PEZI|nr:protein AIM2 [Cladorrhinum samala]